MPIRYYSTNRNNFFFEENISFREALFRGIAKDKGLYMPDLIPTFSRKELDNLKTIALYYHEIAFKVLRKFLHEDIKDEKLSEIIKEAYDFEVPFEHAKEDAYILRLDKGPTASFKDFAARFMARIMNELKGGEDITILVATSGDTGSAVGEAYKGLNGFNVYILYPKDEVSNIQKRQLDCIGGNVKSISIDGKFDDCQKLVKSAFMDKDLAKLNLTSSNSINIGRVLPQICYYFYAYAILDFEELVFSIPSGNFGNALGCEMARRMGLPVSKIIIATNENDEFPRFLGTGLYKKIMPSKSCLSNAMNVGNPSNLARFFDLYGGHLDEEGNIMRLPDVEEMRKRFFSISIDDCLTLKTIKDTYERFGLILEPHGAVAFAALNEYLRSNKAKAVSLETADPAKFPEIIQKELGFSPKIPKSLELILNKNCHSEILSNNYQELKEYLLSNR